MKKLFLIVVLVAFSLQLKAVDFFPGTYEEALVKAKEENKLVLLYFTATWCGPCTYMNYNIFTEESVDLKISTNYIFLKLDVDIPKNRSLYERYNTEKSLSVPGFYFINYKEEIIKKHIGGATLSIFKDFIDIPKWSKPVDKAIENSIVNKNREQHYNRASAFDRFIWDSFHRKWKLGIKAGVNFNNFHTAALYTKYNGLKTGYNFGVFAERATKHFMIEPGIAFYRKGGRDRGNNEDIKLSYIEIPLKLSMNIFKHNFWGAQPVRLNVEPYLSCALSGKVHSDYGTEKVHFGDGVNEFNRIDYGVKLGVSLQMGAFEPSVGYDLGLRNLSNMPNGKMYNRGFYFNMALLFGR